MKKLLILLPVFAFSAQVAMAEPVDSGPPAQQQKNAVPNTTDKGDYLKNENETVAADGTTKSYPCDDKMNSTNKSKTNSPEKGKSHNKPPEKGGVDVKTN